MFAGLKRVVSLASALGIAGLALADEEGGWRKIHEERGITVSTREEAGQELPRFRGQATLTGNVLHVLAILLDDARSKEWAKSADEAEVLRSVDTRTQIIYSRSHQTWPVHDRDLVMRRSIEVLKPGQAFRVRLVCIPGEKPGVKGVIRLAHCETNIALTSVDATHTYVDYRVHADPGGSSPTFLVRWASKNIPLDTLTALGKQIERTRGQYASVVKQWQEAR
jgi:START domain